MADMNFTRNRQSDHKSVVTITQKYIEAENEIRGVILQPTATNLVQHQKKIEESIKNVERKLIKSNREFCTNDLQAAYRKGKSKTDRAISARGVEKGARIRNAEVGNSQYQDVRRGAFADLNGAVTQSIAHLRGEIKTTMRELDTGNRNLAEFQKAIQERLEGHSVLQVEYNNGNQVGVEHYAKMLARSSRIETANIGQFGRAQELGSDLVECTTIAPTCEVCAKYQGRVYSISGNDKRFPHLFGTASYRGFALIHPNCRHEFLPYFEQLRSKEELQRDIRNSNKPFKDTRGDAERSAYAKWQAQNRRNLRERYEFGEMRQRLGDRMPYKTLGGFRRASRGHTKKWNADRELTEDLPLKEARVEMSALNNLDSNYSLAYTDNATLETEIVTEVYNMEKHLKHLKEFGYTSEQDYKNHAAKLLESYVDGKTIYGFTTENGTVFRYDIVNNELAIARPDGYISTLFKPYHGDKNARIKGINYFTKQIQMHGRKKK